MVTKVSIEEMRILLNQAIEKNNKAETFKISQMLDCHIAEYLYNGDHSSSIVKIE